MALLPGYLEALGLVLSRRDPSSRLKLEEVHELQKVAVLIFNRYLDIGKINFSFENE